MKKNVERAQDKQKRYYDLHRKQAHFQVGDVVWVRTHPLSRADEGFMAKLQRGGRALPKLLNASDL